MNSHVQIFTSILNNSNCILYRKSQIIKQSSYERYFTSDISLNKSKTPSCIKNLFYSNSVLKQAGNGISRRHTLLDFFNNHCSKTSKKWRGLFGEKQIFKKKSYNAKKLKGGPFGLARYSMLRWTKERLLYFSFLCQYVRFDTTKFRITFRNYFHQFVRIEKKSQ